MGSGMEAAMGRARFGLGLLLMLASCRATEHKTEADAFKARANRERDRVSLTVGDIDRESAASEIALEFLPEEKFSKIALFGPDGILVREWPAEEVRRGPDTGLHLTAALRTAGRYRLDLKPIVAEAASSEDAKPSESAAETIEFDVEVESFEMPAKPTVTRTVRGDAWTWTYPLYGLPRDLLDAPFTLLRRAEFGRLDVKLNKRPLVQSFVMGVTVAGIVIGVTHGYHAADHSFWKALLLIDVYGIGGAAGGALAGYGVDALFVPVNGIETALLRSGIDDDYWKMGPRFRVPEAGSTNGDLAADERLLRSDAFFPNWQYLACETTLSNPSPSEIRRGTRITKITRVETKPTSPP